MKESKGAPPWRVGRSVGRTIYDADDTLIGVMDTPALAAAAVAAYNRVWTIEKWLTERTDR